MGQAAEKKQYEYSDYLALEEQSQIRHEYFYGEVFAMAGTMKLLKILLFLCVKA